MKKMDTKTLCLICAIAVWICAFVCIPIMKKIAPESYKIYSIYVVCVGIAESFFVAYVAFS